MAGLSEHAHRSPAGGLPYVETPPPSMPRSTEPAQHPPAGVPAPPAPSTALSGPREETR
jgi:hypothetical protein